MQEKIELIGEKTNKEGISLVFTAPKVQPSHNVWSLGAAKIIEIRRPSN